MVAFPKLGSNRARSEKNEDQLEVASVGLNETMSHPHRTFMQNDVKSTEEEDNKLKRLRSFWPVEKQASKYLIDNMMESSSSESRTSDVNLKDNPWRESRVFCTYLFFT